MDYYKLATWFWTSYKSELLTIAWTWGHGVFAPWIPTVCCVYNAPTVANYAWPPCEPRNETRLKASFLLDKEKFLLDSTAPPRIRHLGDCPFLSCSHSAIPASLTSLSPSRWTCSASLRWVIDFRVWYREQDKSFWKCITFLYGLLDLKCFIDLSLPFYSFLAYLGGIE